MIFKPKSPLGKENTRVAGFFNEYIKSGGATHYPNPHSPISQNYMKSKAIKDQYCIDASPQTLPTFNKLTS
jgi:hypothetical protein